MQTRRTVVLVSTLIAASLFFSLGCGLLGDLLEGAAEKALEGVAETLLEEPETALREEAAESASPARPGTTTAWPSWMPAAVPEYPYGDIFQALEAEDGGSLVFVNVQLEPDAYEAYKQDLLSHGWVVEEESVTDVAKHLHVYRNGHALTYAFPRDGQGVALYYFASSGAPSGESAPTTSVTLDELSSYRLERSITVQRPEVETRNIYLFEWTKEPFVYRRMITMGEFMVTDYIWAEGKVWTRSGDGEWIETHDDKPDPLDDVAIAMDFSTEGMTFEGEEIINGVRCRCYVEEIVLPQMTAQSRRCVANQAGIPSLIIYDSLQQTGEDGRGSLTETNLYDVNQPFTIETPE